MALKRRYGALHGAGGYLAVPFPGAMALKRYNRLEDHQRLRPCSPLPRGDGAETVWRLLFVFWSIRLAVPFPGAMALKPTTPQRICLHFLAFALCQGLSRGSQRVD